MSGGYFDYHDLSLKNGILDHAAYNNVENSNVFEDIEISELVIDMLDLIHVFDWYKSGDSCEEDYLNKKEAFKKKWLHCRRDKCKKLYVVTANTYMNGWGAEIDLLRVTDNEKDRDESVAFAENKEWAVDVQEVILNKPTRRYIGGYTE